MWNVHKYKSKTFCLLTWLVLIAMTIRPAPLLYKNISVAQIIYDQKSDNDVAKKKKENEKKFFNEDVQASVNEIIIDFRLSSSDNYIYWNHFSNPKVFVWEPFEWKLVKFLWFNEWGEKCNQLSSIVGHWSFFWAILKNIFLLKNLF